MPVRQTDLQHTRTRKLASVAVIALVLSIMVGGALLIRQSRSGNDASPTSTAYTKAIEDAKQSGVPVTAKLLQAPPPPPEQNAAPIYSRLTALLTAHPLSQEDKIADLLTAQQVPSNEQIERVRRVFKHRPELLPLIHQATARPECVFVRDWSYPNAVQLKEIAPMREAARLLVAESVLLAHDGKPLEAVRNQALGFTIAHHVASENHLIGHMTAVTVDSITLRGLQKILYIAGSDPAVANSVRSTIEKRWRPHSLARACQTEAGANVVDLQVLRGQGPSYLNEYLGDNTSKPLHMSPQEWNDFIDENGSVLLKQERKVIAAADLPYRRASSVLKAVSNEVENDSNHRHLLMLVMFPMYSGLAERQAGDDATANLTRAAAALLAWRGKHGSFPPTLAAALTPPPIDPFNGKALQYRREGPGFVVYSVGMKGTETGGTPAKKPGPFAILFRYPLPPYYAGPLREN